VAEKRRGLVRDQIDTVVTACRGGWQVLRHKGPGQITFWFIALVIGIAAGFCRAALPQGDRGAAADALRRRQTSG
jgi:CIC family chloride channel protein